MADDRSTTRTRPQRPERKKRVRPVRPERKKREPIDRPRPRIARLGTGIYLLLAFVAYLLPVALTRPGEELQTTLVNVLAFPWSLLAMMFRGTGPIAPGLEMLFLAIGILANAWIIYAALAWWSRQRD
ncbi:MAG: hypothetical protein ACREMD_12440 [Gemmatimonadota bacterium]